jgi:hypothetical protein
MDLEAINHRIVEVQRGRKWILTPDVAAAATRAAAQLEEQGVEGIMVIAGSEGVGDLPAVDRIHYTRTSGATIMEGFRAYRRSIEEPSVELLEAVDAFDPEGTARVLGAGFSRRGHLAGRPVYGVRPAEWGALEDKMVVDDLWDAAGIDRTPSSIVDVPDAPVASAELAGDLGSVWVADNREGWHGGGEYTRWLRSQDDVASALDWFSDHADRVRVMPFLDGLPCSIHGFITNDGVAVFRPVELFILREVDRPLFYYAQAANYWTPPPQIFDQMRAAARSVGEVLVERVGYRGAFGIDGICTLDGFRPTELNPRFSVGHGLQTRAAEIPLRGMELLMLEGDLEISARALEDAILRGTRTARGGGIMFPLTAEYARAETGFAISGDRAIAVDIEEPNDGVMMIGPAAFGSLVIVRPDPDRTPIGPSLAPLAIQLLDLARDLWGMDAPKVTHAPDLLA